MIADVRNSNSKTQELWTSLSIPLPCRPIELIYVFLSHIWKLPFLLFSIITPKSAHSLVASFGSRHFESLLRRMPPRKISRRTRFLTRNSCSCRCCPFGKYFPIWHSQNTRARVLPFFTSKRLKYRSRNGMLLSVTIWRFAFSVVS